MRCTWFEDRLGAHLDGTLRPREAAAVTAHVRTCAACAALYDELRVVDALLHTSRPIEAPTVVSAVMHGVRAQPVARRPHVPLWLALTLYLAIAWLAIAALWLLGGADAFTVPLGNLGSAARGASDAYAATLRTFGPLVPSIAAVVAFVLLVDAALAVALFAFYRYVRPRLASHLADTESA